MGYLSFGKTVKGSIVSNYPKDDPLFLAIRACLVLSRMVVMPVRGRTREGKRRRSNISHASLH